MSNSISEEDFKEVKALFRKMTFYRYLEVIFKLMGMEKIAIRYKARRYVCGATAVRLLPIRAIQESLPNAEFLLDVAYHDLL